jgi:2-methylcitrate dehydratase PrpD
MGKTFQVAAANRNGVTAALLARQGCFAPLDILDNTRGLFDAYLDKSDAGKELLDRLGDYYATNDVMHKRYSAGTPNQTYLQGLFKILHDSDLVRNVREGGKVLLQSQDHGGGPRYRRVPII